MGVVSSLVTLNQRSSGLGGYQMHLKAGVGLLNENGTEVCIPNIESPRREKTVGCLPTEQAWPHRSSLSEPAIDVLFPHSELLNTFPSKGGWMA